MLISFKYGLKAIARSKLRTALFAILLAAVTLFLSLSIAMWRSAETMLDKADEVFVTAGELVYTLGNYPETDYFDPKLAAVREEFDLGSVDIDGVLELEPQFANSAYAQGFTAEKKDMLMGNYAVLTMEIGNYYESFASYPSVIKEQHYLVSDSSSGLSLKSAHVSPLSGGGELEMGHTYVLFGYFYNVSGEAMNRFQVLTFSEALGELAPQGSFAPYVDVSDGESAFWSSDAGAYYENVIELLRVVNSTVSLVATQSVEAVEPFHRGEYTMIDGGFFTETDYKSGTACIIPDAFAKQLDLSVGDELPLHVFTQGIESVVQSYTVAGIYQAERSGTPIYIPNVGQDWLAISESDYTLGRVRVDNRSAEEFEAAVAPLLPEGVRLELYDQGYFAAAKPLVSMRETAVFICVVSAFACLLVLWFFAYLFVFRNGVSVRILLMLGSGMKRTGAFLLSGCGAVVATSAAIGSLIGLFVSQSVISAVYAAIQTGSVYDYRFSIRGFGLQSDVFTAVPKVEPIVYLLIALGVFLLAMIMCALFALRVMRAQNAHYRYKRAKKQSNKPVSAKNAVSIPLPGVSLRYSVTSILRGGGKSVIVPALFAALILVMCVFTGIRAGYEQKLESVYDETEVILRITDVTGRKVDGLAIPDYQLETISETGFTAEGWTATNMRYMYNGMTKSADGSMPSTAPAATEIPTNSYAREFFLGQLRMNTAPIVGTDDLSRTPEFFYFGEPNITWAEGLGWEDYINGAIEGTNIIRIPRYHITPKGLYVPEEGFDEYTPAAFYCLVPTTFLAQNNLSLGDMILLSVYEKQGSNTVMTAMEFVVAGAYEPRGTQGTIYAPTQRIFHYDTDYIYNAKGFATDYTIFYVFDSAGFILKNTQNLSELKDILSESYEQIGRVGANRKWVVIDDKALYDTVDELTRHIGYMDMLYPIILALVAAIGFIASALLLRGRLEEIAILRSLGAGRRRVFLSFFLDSVILSVPGIAVGLGLSILILSGWQTQFLLNAALFAPCYYLGSASAIVQAYRRAVLQSLGQKED